MFLLFPFLSFSLVAWFESEVMHTGQSVILSHFFEVLQPF